MAQRVTSEKRSRKSDTALAVRYALSRWDALLRYVDDSCIEIDNHAAERSLRAVALGRKNYLFAGSDAGGERAAAIYSLIGTAKLNGLDPEAYLRTCYPGSPIIRSTASTNYCRGTLRRNSTRLPLAPPNKPCSLSTGPRSDAYEGQVSTLENLSSGACGWGGALADEDSPDLWWFGNGLQSLGGVGRECGESRGSTPRGF